MFAKDETGRVHVFLAVMVAVKFGVLLMPSRIQHLLKASLKFFHCREHFVLLRHIIDA